MRGDRGRTHGRLRNPAPSSTKFWQACHLEQRHSAICNLIQWPLWVFQRPPAALAVSGRAKSQVTPSKGDSQCGREHGKPPLGCAHKPWFSRRLYPLFPGQEEKKNKELFPNPHPGETVSVFIFDRVLCSLSQFSFWRNDLMHSQQMRRKGPWGKGEGRGREGGRAVLPWPGEVATFLIKRHAQIAYSCAREAAL